ncbi:unnamed protein product [Ostreobium quekettii]|uniref:DNA-directed RNA polymerase III subunit RPC6 n=1 Tax=Ostreobium quekettii TaxID=121088 RepID=A0A8S1J1R3_9CHLO|nr:unnamed protein product [Ostreobium quekettii]|eukprot:evm.model.scf_179.3 EVM.evm.TU.scf_179.3   scf_179:22474-25427(+)
MAQTPEQLVLGVARKNPEGASDAILERELADLLTVEQRANAINSLLQTGRLQLFSSGTGLVYKEVDLNVAIKFRGLGTEELLVYQVVEQSRNSGIWTKEMKSKTGLAQPQLTKILKNLETRQLVKTFRPVENKTRKMYILYSLEPAEHLTGGAWYTDMEKDTEFIEVLQEACFRVINHRGLASLADIADFIRSKNLSRVDLSNSNIKSIVDTLIYDGRVDEVEGSSGVQYRSALLQLPDSSALTSVPCGVCPVFNECRPGGIVSPESCIYYDKWLDF